MSKQQPNPAQQRRNRIVEAIREQQGEIESLRSQNRALISAVGTLAVAAGVGAHPKFAGIVRAAGLKVADADNNDGDSVGGTPATTTEEARKPDSTDDVENVGATSGDANDGVTPEGVTDVNNSDVVANPPVLDNLQDATQPVSGTDSVDPKASDQGANKVNVGTPSNDTFDGPAFQSQSSRGSEQERFVASMRLARLRISAGLEQGEDLALGQKIAAGKETLGEINAQVSALSAVASRSAQAPTSEQARRLVPRAASRGVQRTSPSMQAVASSEARPGEDEWMVGGVED